VAVAGVDAVEAPVFPVVLEAVAPDVVPAAAPDTVLPVFALPGFAPVAVEPLETCAFVRTNWLPADDALRSLAADPGVLAPVVPAVPAVVPAEVAPVVDPVAPGVVARAAPVSLAMSPLCRQPTAVTCWPLASPCEPGCEPADGLGD
jgi:hypothetical protein